MTRHLILTALLTTLSLTPLACGGDDTAPPRVDSGTDPGDGGGGGMDAGGDADAGPAPGDDAGSGSDAGPGDDAGSGTDAGLVDAGTDAGMPDPCAGVDCSGMTDMCNVGVCNAATGACMAIPIMDGTMCSDANACTVGDVCTAGTCGGTNGCPTGISFTGLGNSTPFRGNSVMGRRSRDVCPAGEVVRRVTGWTASASGGIGQITVECGRLSVIRTPRGNYTVTVGTGTRLTTRGTTRVSTFDLTCPPNEMVNGFGGRATANQLERLFLYCRPLTITGSPGSYVLSVGAETQVGFAGGTGGTAFPTSRCPIGDVAVGANIQYGTVIHGMQLRCNTPMLTY